MLEDIIIQAITDNRRIGSHPLFHVHKVYILFIFVFHDTYGKCMERFYFISCPYNSALL